MINAYIAIFIAAAIFLMVGTQILGGSTLDCTKIDGYSNATGNPVKDSTGWGKQCVDAAQLSQTGYGILTIILVVLAAIAILVVIRYLG